MFENFIREQPVPLKTQRSCKGKQVCVGGRGQAGDMVHFTTIKTGIHKAHVRKKAAEVAETSMGLRSLTGDLGERGSQVHIKPPKPGKSTQMDLSGRQLAVGKPGRYSWQRIRWRGGRSVVTLRP